MTKRTYKMAENDEKSLMEITDYGKSVERKDGTSLEINFWSDGENVISGVGYDDVVFGGIPGELMLRIQKTILDYKNGDK